MEKCSLYSKVAVLFTRKLGQEQTIDGKRGDRASEFALHGQNTEKLLINTCMGMLMMLTLIKMRSHFLVILTFWYYVN